MTILENVTAAPRQSDSSLDGAIDGAVRALLRAQRADGHWVFELEADATIPAEYIMLGHFLDEIDVALERKICAYLRRVQNSDGGWPLFYRGDTNLSATVKAYYALKLAGESPHAPHMVRARDRVLERGGAAACNVFTRFALALFGQVPWRAVPAMPVEIMFAPRWFPFHLDKVSYWSRTVMVPLLVLAALRPQARNPRRVDVRELFVVAPEEEKHYNRAAAPTVRGREFLAVDTLLRRLEPLVPSRIRARAVAAAMRFILERLNGEDGLGAIFPAMANALMALAALGYERDHPARAAAKRAVERLVVARDDEAYCQPCVSPIWDTSLTVHALLETKDDVVTRAVADANDWLASRQVTDVVGDWARKRPGLRPGGWAFQYWNDHYPDVDDTAAVALALHRGDARRFRGELARAAEWVLGMQSNSGGWGAFDAENEHYALNEIPFADHGALLDPPTDDVSGRCVGMLLQMGFHKDHPAVAGGLAYLRRTQQADGSWFGRWGTNYIYGTWSVLNAFLAAGETTTNSLTVRRAASYLLRFQQRDGGWGEDGSTYDPANRSCCKESTPSQTAWALLGLMAAGEAHHPAVARGVAFLLERRNAEGLWDEPWYTAVGFPRVFYLRYHGYCAFFPLFALARYRNLVPRGEPLPRLGF
ncbi:MAG: squalene--hopene cyclase [Candidatus Eremiobacteraeota bacterium]|nr:squalene--hopene cyclase [Candidatus Eremiobacteraeota bacterium]